MPDLTHLAGRTTQTAVAAQAPHPRAQIYLAAVVQLGELAAAGDEGGVRNLLHDLQHGHTWGELDPWQLLRLSVLRAARR